MLLQFKISREEEGPSTDYLVYYLTIFTLKGFGCCANFSPIRIEVYFLLFLPLRE